jgi:hypothetical protein
MCRLFVLISTMFICGSALQAGSGGGALYLSEAQGVYIPRFPLPAQAVTIDVWVKIVLVQL